MPVGWPAALAAIFTVVGKILDLLNQGKLSQEHLDAMVKAIHKVDDPS